MTFADLACTQAPRAPGRRRAPLPPRHRGSAKDVQAADAYRDTRAAFEARHGAIVSEYWSITEPSGVATRASARSGTVAPSGSGPQRPGRGTPFGPARQGPRRSCGSASSRSSRAGTPRAARLSPTTSRRWTASATCSCRRLRLRASRLTPVRRAQRPGPARAVPERARDSYRPALPAAAPPVGGIRVLGHREGDFRVSGRMAREVLSLLPMFPGIAEEQLDRVVAATGEFLTVAAEPRNDALTG